MRTDDVLGVTGTGLWRWEGVPGQATLDATAAALAGLPAEQVTLDGSAVRARIHPADHARLTAAVDRAVDEDVTSETQFRIVSERGEVLRTVRSRMRAQWQGTEMTLSGTLVEIDPAAERNEGSDEQFEGIGERMRSRDAFLLNAGRALVEARSTDEVLQVVAALSMPGFSPDGHLVFGLEGDRLSVLGYHGFGRRKVPAFQDVPLDAPYPAAQVVRTGRPVFISSRDEYRRRFPTMYPMIKEFGRQAWAYLPLNVGGRPMGVWLATFSYQVAFTADERSILTTLARMMAQALARTSVRDSEQALSAALQEMMRTEKFPEIPGMLLSGRYVPTGGGLQVGGDWHDVIPLPSGRFALVIGDVQGHDIQAATTMAQLRMAVRAFASEGHGPDAVLARASHFMNTLVQSLSNEPVEERFATCLYLEVNPSTGAVDVVRAGHLNPAVRLTDGTLMSRPIAGGLPLGIALDSELPITRIVLEPQQTLLVFTDGLIETGGHDLKTGWERLVRVSEETSAARPRSDIRGSLSPSLEKFADDLIQAVHGPTSHHRTGPLADRREDDIALLLLYREEPDLEAAAEVEQVRRIVLTVAKTEPAMISEARHQLHAFLHDWHDDNQVEAATLMLSEVLANVFKHTESDALVMCELSGEEGRRRLRVEVTDHSNQMPTRRDPGELASSGRGLTLLAVLASNWGVEPRGAGKVIWFELDEAAPTPVWEPEA